MLKQNEAETCDDSPQEKLTVKVGFDQNTSPSDKGDVEIDPQQQQEEPYLIAKGREKRVHKATQRYGFEDMALVVQLMCMCRVESVLNWI